MTINQIIEDERLALTRELQRHLARGNWAKAAEVAVKEEYLARLKKRVQDTEAATTRTTPALS